MSGWDRDDVDRRLFTARAALPAPAPPPFAAVLVEVRRRRSMLRRRAAWVSLAAAAAVIAAVGAARRAPTARTAPTAIAEPPSFACSDDPRALALEAAAYATDRAIASAEDQYAACLVATPRSVPASTEAACGISVETEVTCGTSRR